MTSRFFRGVIPWGEYTEALDLRVPAGVEAPEPTWNIAPSSLVPVIRPREHGAPGLDLALKLWGLVPQWWREPLSEKKWQSFNARAEGIGESATFRGAYRYRRCLVPASGFYLWSGAAGRRVPYAVGVRGAAWFCMAGVWERWGFDGGEYDTFAIITVPANSVLAAHGERMPALIAPPDYARWLDPALPAPAGMLAPLPDDLTEDWPAHPDVGNVRLQDESMTGLRP